MFLYISNLHKAIFIHNPKVAGTYISYILTKLYDFEKIIINKTDEDYINFTENSNLDKINNKLKTCQIRKKGIYRYLEDIINDEKYKDYFKFTFVRNPYTKIISAWNFSTNYSNDIYFKDSDINHIDDYEFDDFIREGKNNCSDFAYFHSFITQTDHLINSEKKINFDFIGKYENLKEDFIIVLKKLNINEFKHINNVNDKPINFSLKTKPNSYYLTKDNIAIINKYFENDFINFNYSLK